MKNVGMQFKQTKQYQGTFVGFYGQYTGIICHTQNVARTDSFTLACWDVLLHPTG